MEGERSEVCVHGNSAEVSDSTLGQHFCFPICSSGRKCLKAYTVTAHFFQEKHFLVGKNVLPCLILFVGNLGETDTAVGIVG